LPSIPTYQGVVSSFGFILPVRMDGFKLEGGELFKEDFRKLLSKE